MKQCPYSDLEINTNLTFYIQQDDSKSESEIKYWRSDSNKIQEFKFTNQGIDHLDVVFDGFYLRCSGHAICNDRGLPKDEDVKAVVLSVDFNPRSGAARHNQWQRNKYSLYGSFYSTSCKAGIFYCYSSYKCLIFQCIICILTINTLFLNIYWTRR